MENVHTFYTAIIVMIGGLLFIAVYWLARSDRVIKELGIAVLKGATQIEYAANMIAAQRARITELEAEINRLRSSNVIELRHEPVAVTECPYCRATDGRHYNSCQRSSGTILPRQ